MDRRLFETHLRTAAQISLEFAREYVLQQLPDQMAFLVYPNQSYDGHPRVGDEVVFPSESLQEGQYHGPWAVDDVVEFLWRDGKVPEWIDIAVESVDGGRTLFGLLCCGRFTGTEEHLYYRYQERVTPFGIKSPPVPPGWESVEASGKFDLKWRELRSYGR